MNKENQLNRRSFIKLLGASVIFGPPSIDGALWVPEIIQAWTEVDIRTHTLHDPRIHNTYCLIHTSDAHFSTTSTYQGFIDYSAAENIVKTINSNITDIKTHHPDITILSVNTGDFVIQSPNLDKLDSLEKGLSALNKINADQHIAVLGNHDNGYGNQAIITQMIKNAGFNILDADEYVSSLSYNNEDLQILGTPDYTTHQSIYESSSNLEYWQKIFEEKIPKIWLTHNAQIIDKLGFSRLARKNVLLSLHGHTHGGQVSEKGFYRQMIRDIALNQIGYKSSLINGVYHTEGDSYWKNVNTGLGGVTGDLIHTRGIRPRVDLITILPGRTNSLRWDKQQIIKYR